MVRSTGISSRRGTRKLRDLISVGPAMLRDFELLGIRSVAQLARSNPREMYRPLCELTGETGHLLSRCLSGSGGAGARSAAADGEVRLVVLESKAKGRTCRNVNESCR